MLEGFFVRVIYGEDRFYAIVHKEFSCELPLWESHWVWLGIEQLSVQNYFPSN
jgi:hypothetical protein